MFVQMKRIATTALSEVNLLDGIEAMNMIAFKVLMKDVRMWPTGMKKYLEC